MLNVKRKKVDLIIVEQSCVKDVKIYLYGLKKTCLGVLERGDRGKNNATNLKEGGVIEMSTTVLPYTRCTLFFALYLLTIEDVLRNHYQRIQIHTYKYLKRRKSRCSCNRKRYSLKQLVILLGFV